MIPISEVTRWDSSISNDVAQAWIDYLTARIEDYVGRKITLSTYTNELYEGSGTEFLQLKAWPIKKVTALEINGSQVEAEDLDGTMQIHGSHKDFLLRVDGCKWPRSFGGIIGVNGELYGHGAPNIKVSYQAGYGCIPADLALAMGREIVKLNSESPSAPGTLVELRTPGGLHSKWRPVNPANNPSSPFGTHLTEILHSPRFKATRV